MKHYTFVDYVTQGYLAWVAVLIALFHGTAVPEWPWLLPAHVACLALIHGLIQFHHRRHSPGRLLDFLRNFYPVLLYTAFYRETGLLNHMFTSDYLDPVFVQLEDRIFGFQPCIDFMTALPWRSVSEMLYAAYFSYYLMIAGVGLALFIRNRQQFHHYVSVTSFVFYLCYTTYIFLPVMGPRVFFREIEGYRLPEELQDLAGSPFFPASVQSGFFYQIMKFIYHHFESPGAAFPSSHVAIAVCTLFFSWRYLPRIRWFHGVMVVLLCLSTVYGRYHYAVDVFAGVLTALVLVPLGNWLYARWGMQPDSGVSPARNLSA